jgi:archaellum component FlaF (FlaF/FlaG flagellin family)
VNGQTVTANSQGTLVVNGQTVTANSQGTLVVNGQTVTVNSQGNLVANGQTVTVNSQGNLIVNGQTITANSQGNFVVGTQTLTAGGLAITISGKTISLATGATGTTEIIYGGTSTTHLESVIQSSKSVTTAPAQYTGEAGRGVEMGMARAVCMAVAFSVLMVWL